ncbi:hypothetical protein LEP1GSC186_0617 [Leptospira noguchii serovar Autumnalis str. ZUN142]|uniref:Uncharacterized protein n=1 Tax=Leptospira noguchii serovar Autumnalis str. ZUN142 TaxID=1085540 RepID=M6UU29_9LEPT|nr:hypothetical protein LEP1GSC186_0617 [Leptospira noguchii serovar Autumnalis str. ZUN142]
MNFSYFTGPYKMKYRKFLLQIAILRFNFETVGTITNQDFTVQL